MPHPQPAHNAHRVIYFSPDNSPFSNDLGELIPCSDGGLRGDTCRHLQVVNSGLPGEEGPEWQFRLPKM